MEEIAGIGAVPSAPARLERGGSSGAIATVQELATEAVRAAWPLFLLVSTVVWLRFGGMCSVTSRDIEAHTLLTVVV